MDKKQKAWEIVCGGIVIKIVYYDVDCTLEYVRWCERQFTPGDITMRELEV